MGIGQEFHFDGWCENCVVDMPRLPEQCWHIPSPPLSSEVGALNPALGAPRVTGCFCGSGELGSRLGTEINTTACAVGRFGSHPAPPTVQKPYATHEFLRGSNIRGRSKTKPIMASKQRAERPKRRGSMSAIGRRLSKTFSFSMSKKLLTATPHDEQEHIPIALSVEAADAVEGELNMEVTFHDHAHDHLDLDARASDSRGYPPQTPEPAVALQLQAAQGAGAEKDKAHGLASPKLNQQRKRTSPFSTRELQGGASPRITVPDSEHKAAEQTTFPDTLNVCVPCQEGACMIS